MELEKVQSAEQERISSRILAFVLCRSSSLSFFFAFSLSAAVVRSLSSAKLPYGRVSLHPINNGRCSLSWASPAETGTKA